MICKHCNTENPDDRLVCLRCGKELPGAARPNDSLSGKPTIPPEERYAKDSPPADGTPHRPGSSDTLDAAPTINVRASTPVPESTAESPGDLIGDDYEIIEEIGRGGMGVVYRARDRKLGREVAVKRLLAPNDSARRGIGRFLQEARAIAALNHRNIVTIHEIGKDDDGPFIVMEYLPGGNLENRIDEQGGLEMPQALSIIKGVGQALAHAHRRNVVHRAVKPSNIILTDDGAPKLADFGLAQMARKSELSMTGYGMATLAYMAPEQRRDAKRADHRSDIYALAKTLYHTVTGELPDDVDLDIVPAEIRPTVKRAIKPKPEDRPFSVEEFLQDLDNPAVADGSARAVSAKPGACPNCGEANPEEVKFCQSCGAGLFDKCPQCGAEDPVGIRHCGSCGVSIIRYRGAQEALVNARQHLEGFRYGRAIKEADRGLQAGYFTDELNVLRTQASENKDRLASLRKMIDMMVEEQRYEELENAIEEALRLDPTQEPLPVLQTELPEFIRRRDAERRRAEPEAEIERAPRGIFTRQILRLKAVAVIVSMFVVLCYACWAGASNQLHLASAREHLAADRLGAAREELGKAGWFCAWGKDAVADNIDNAEYERLMERAGAREKKGEYLAAAEDYFKALELARKPTIVKEKVEQLKTDLLAQADEMEKNQEYSKAIETLVVLEQIEKTPDLHKASKERLRRLHLKLVKPITNSIGMKLVYIPPTGPGGFLMGSPAAEGNRDDDEARHTVILRKGFWMGTTEVTIKQFLEYLNGGGDSSDVDLMDEDCPVEKVDGWFRMKAGDARFWGSLAQPMIEVSWHSADKFCKWLSGEEGKHYRLPTEAEWEYACRAETTTPFNTGDTISTRQANYDGNYVYGNGRKGVYREKTIPVGSFAANKWGLHDTHGNVWEWCSDWYAEDYPEGTVTNWSGPKTGVSRVLRGGSWYVIPWSCRSAMRSWDSPVSRNSYFGFRVCQDSE